MLRTGQGVAVSKFQELQNLQNTIDSQLKNIYDLKIKHNNLMYELKEYAHIANIIEQSIIAHKKRKSGAKLIIPISFPKIDQLYVKLKYEK